jgi:hypothetical protein
VSDVSKFVDDPRLFQLASLTFLSSAGSTGDDSQEMLTDARVMVDVLAFVSALVVESDPAASTNQGLRLRGEDIGKRVAAYARAIREEGQASGEPFIRHFGGTGNNVPMAGDGERPN